MEINNEILKLLKCKYCSELYSKTNKPKIMLCGHNICSHCLKLNKNNLLCLDCNKRYNNILINKFSINFALLETTNNINNDSKIDESIIKGNFYCVNCKLNLSNNYHLILYKNHILKKKNDDVQKIKDNNEIMNEYKNLYNNFKEFNTKISEKNNEYLDKLFNLLKKENDNINFENYDFIKLLNLIGLINKADEKRLNEFNKKILKNEEYLNLIENSKNYQDLIEKVKELKNNNKDKIQYLNVNEFFSLLCYYNEICFLKLNNINEYISNLENKLNNDFKYKKQFLTNLNFQINYTIGDYLSLLDIYKLSYFIYDNNLYIYEPIQNEFFKYNIEINESEILSSFLSSNFILYLLTKENLIIYNLSNNEKNLKKLDEPIIEYTQIFLLEGIIYKISCNSFQSLNINEQILTNEWKNLNLFEINNIKIKKPKIVQHNNSFFYVLDYNEKEIKNIFIYDINKDEWKKKYLTFSNDGKEKNNNRGLFIKDYILYNKGYVTLIGGYIKNRLNDNVFIIDASKKIIYIKEKIKFDLNKDEKIKEINIAINKNIIFITLLIENDEKEIYFRIINKKMDEINSTFKMFLKKILINEIKLKN